MSTISKTLSDLRRKEKSSQRERYKVILTDAGNTEEKKILMAREPKLYGMLGIQSTLRALGLGGVVLLLL